MLEYVSEMENPGTIKIFVRILYKKMKVMLSIIWIGARERTEKSWRM